MLNTVLVVSLELLECGYYEFGGVRTISVDISNIDATPQEILCLINDSDTRTYRWSRPYGDCIEWQHLLTIEPNEKMMNQI